MEFLIQKNLRTNQGRKSDSKGLIIIGSKISFQMEPTKPPRKMCKIPDQGTMGSYQFLGEIMFFYPCIFMRYLFNFKFKFSQKATE